MTPLKVRNVLIRARQLLVQKGWVKGMIVKTNKMGDPVGYCALGAITVSSKDPAVRQKAKDVLRSVLPDDMTIISWNDKATSKKAILSKFNQAIERTKFIK